MFKIIFLRAIASCLVLAVFIGQVSAASITYYHNDASGSPSLATDETGEVVWEVDYSAFGEKHTGSSESENAYHGYVYDYDAELYLAGDRYYDPSIGRFWSIDPKGVGPYDLSSVNRYSYAANNPNKYVDPDGNSPLDVAFLIYDVGKLGLVLYSGGNVAGAVADVGLSVVGVFSPVPGTGQALKAARAVDRGANAIRAGNRANHASKAAKAADGVVYLRTNPRTGERYVGQAKSWERFVARQKEHNRKLQAEHEYEVLGRAEPGQDLSVLEEVFMQKLGGLQREGGSLANKRHAVSESRLKKFRSADF